MILADTSVWAEHFRRGSQEITAVLADKQIYTHPYVIGELAAGNLTPRKETLYYFSTLPLATVATQEEYLYFIERHRLFGKGLNFVDLSLLCSCVLSGIALWSLDKKLNLAFQSLRH